MEQNQFEEKLNEIIPKFYEINETAKSSKKESDSYKDEIKNIFEELDISEYSSQGIKVSVTKIEKTSLIEPLVIEYLKSHNLNHLVKSKEYIDEAEILMAASKGELNVVDLEPFTNTKIENRINVKRGK